MHFTSVEVRGEYFARVTFVRGDDSQAKNIRLSDCVRKVSKPEQYPIEFMRSVELAAREANRDMIIREVGMDDVRNHPDWNKRFTYLASEVAALI